MTNGLIEAPVNVDHEQYMRNFAKAAYREIHAIRQSLDVETINIDEWKWEQLATTFQPQPNFDGPIVITAILAVFPTTSTSVTINLGTPGRIIPVTALSTGLFATGDGLRIQLGQDDVPRNMVIAPAGAGYINFFGYADRKTRDHLDR